MTLLVRRSPSRNWWAMPYYRPMSIWSELERFFGDMERPLYYEHAPRLDVLEEEDRLVVRGEFPGVKSEDLDISLEGETLRISAEKKEEEVSEGATYYTCERHFGRFARSIALPFPVDAEKLSATFENGLLEISLPKAEAAKPKRIEVKASAPRLKKGKAAKTTD